MLLRLILFTHRYLAVAVGLLVSLWCLSGFVMMYQSFPAYTQGERLQALTPLEWGSCCNTTFLPNDDEPLRAFRIEMLLDEPVLRQQQAVPLRLRDGTAVKPLTQAQLLEVSAQYAARRGLADASPQRLGEVAGDQGSVQIGGRKRA
jgi:hypothetical protein